MSELKTGLLIRESVRFVRKNFSVLQYQIRPIFFAVIACEFLDRIGVVYNKSWILPLTAIFSLYFYALFWLSWQRSVLLGASKEHRVDFLNPKKDGWRVLGLFFIWSLISIPCFIPAVASLYMVHDKGKSGLCIFLALMFLGVLGSIYIMSRFVFVLSARAVSKKISFPQAFHLSKKSIWPMFGASAFVGTFFLLSFFAYGFIAQSLTSVFIPMSAHVTVFSILFNYALSIPVYVIELLCFTLNITIVSIAFRWSVENSQAA